MTTSRRTRSRPRDAARSGTGLSAEQRLRLLDVRVDPCPPWLSPAQTLRTAAQEIALDSGRGGGLRGRSGGEWRVLGESREDSSTLGDRIGSGPTFAAAVDALDERAAARWLLEGREHTLVSLPVARAGPRVVLVLEGDWTRSATRSPTAPPRSWRVREPRRGAAGMAAYGSWRASFSTVH